MKRPHKRSLAPKGDSEYIRLWRIVRGAVADTMNMHPDYIAPGRRRAALESLCKRVTGAVYSELPPKGGEASGKTGG